jgi:hypothetical protein
MTFGAKAGDELRLDPVGFAARQASMRERLDLKGIDDADGMACVGQVFRDIMD